MSDTIPGLKLIRHNAGGVNLPDDPSYTFRLEVVLRAPEFMRVAFVMLYGDEEIVVRGKTRKALEKFVERNNLRTHSRLLRLKITGPDGVVKQTPKG